jgi:hypothetical protein
MQPRLRAGVGGARDEGWRVGLGGKGREWLRLLHTPGWCRKRAALARSAVCPQVPIPEATAVKYFRDVVKGLEYLHFNRQARCGACAPGVNG